MFGGDDKHPGSGKLELRYHDGRPSYISEDLLFVSTSLHPDPECLSLIDKRQ